MTMIYSLWQGIMHALHLYKMNMTMSLQDEYANAPTAFLERFAVFPFVAVYRQCSVHNWEVTVGGGSSAPRRTATGHARLEVICASG